MAGGRGSVVFLRDSVRRWVLRHYRRGGAVASLLDDRYLWTGEERTRVSGMAPAKAARGVAAARARAVAAATAARLSFIVPT